MHPVGALDLRRLVRIAQGQHWVVSGGGAVLFVGVRWPDLAARRANGEDAYLELLLGLGRVGQAVILALHSAGMGAWMTPALDEALAAELFGLDPSEEMLYMIKFGVPARSAPIGRTEPPEAALQTWR